MCLDYVLASSFWSGYNIYMYMYTHTHCLFSQRRTMSLFCPCVRRNLRQTCGTLSFPFAGECLAVPAVRRARQIMHSVGASQRTRWHFLPLCTDHLLCARCFVYKVLINLPTLCTCVVGFVCLLACLLRHGLSV